MISNAAPQQAMPPPISRMSTSSSMISGFPNPYSAIAVFLYLAASPNTVAILAWLNSFKVA